MNSAAPSIGAGSFSHNDNIPQVLKTNAGEIRVQISTRARLRTAVSLASLMAASTAAAQDAGGLQLPTIDVTGDQGGGYQATQQSITRLPVPLLDTPQTVNVVTQQVIKEQRATTMEDALRNVSGITFSAGEGGQQGDSPFIRGFTARGDIFRDGIRDPGWYTRDLFSIDRVEVYKGPSGFAFGRGSTGGAINNVTKLPLLGNSYAEGTMTGTTGPGFRADMDANGTKDNITGRITALYENLDTPDRDNVWTKRWGMAPSATIKLDESTKATLSYIYQGEESVPDYGFPYLPPPTYSPTTGALTNPGYNGNGSAVTPVPLPRNTFLGFPSGPFADVVDTQAHIVTGWIEHEFSPDTKIVNALRYMRVDRFSEPTSPRNLGIAGQLTGPATTPPAGYPVDDMTIGQQHWENQTDNTQLINQTDFVSKFDTGLLKHTFNAGLELSRETRHQQRDNLCYPVSGGTTPPGAPVCRVTVVDPAPNPFGPADTGWGGPQDTLMTDVGIYAGDQIKITKYLELMGALRYDYLRTTYDDLTQTIPANQHLQTTDGMLGWRYGIIVHPVENTSLYFSQGTSFNPSSELGTLSSGTVSDAPEQTNVKEIGAKADVLGGRLSLNAALFRIDKLNMRVPLDPTQTGANAFQILSGVARSDGYELGVAGKLTDQWAIFAGYTQLWTEILQTTDLSQLGRQLPNAPPRSLSLWTTYDITPQFTIGAGATYNSDTFANAQNTEYVPEYWKFDAMASYQIDSHSTIQLNVYNLTNEFYYAQYYSGQAVPAPGRYASLTFRTRW